MSRQAPDRAPARFDPLAAGKTDEGVTAEALAPDDGLEEVRIRTISELRVQRERCVKVRARLGEQRNAGIALRCEFFELELGHKHSPVRPWGTTCGLGGTRRRAARDAFGLAAPAAPATPGERS